MGFPQPRKSQTGDNRLGDIEALCSYLARLANPLTHGHAYPFSSLSRSKLWQYVLAAFTHGLFSQRKHSSSSSVHVLPPYPSLQLH